MRKYLILLVTLFFLGCSEEIYSVQYLKNNRELTLSIIDKCNNPKKNYYSENCKNAKKAEMILKMEEDMKDFNRRFN